MQSVTYKNILITGASSGIGKSFAYQFAEQWANLILVARSGDELEKIKLDLESTYKVSVTTIVLDLAQPGAGEHLYALMQEKWLQVDVLVNNAGFGRWETFEDVSRETYHEMIQLNITTLMDLCHLYLTDMKKRNAWGIINVASAAAFVPVPYAAVYGATKSFVLDFTEALRAECYGLDITITCLCPSGTTSRFSEIARGGRKSEKKEAGYESAESVVKKGIQGFLSGAQTVVTGSSKWQVLMLPRIFSRKMVLKIAHDVFKKVAKEG